MMRHATWPTSSARLSAKHDGVAQMKKQHHEARVVKGAKEIARSGRHIGWFYVASELRERGEPLALQILEKEPFRSEIDLICIEARKRKREQRHAPWTQGPEETS